MLVLAGLAKDRDEAARLIMAGLAVVGDKRADKPGCLAAADSPVRLKSGAKPEYVSRGGFKLKGAIDAFGLDMKDASVLDIGSSTGGFTDAALKEGARVVYSLDVGRGLIHNSLRGHGKVRLLEGINFREAPFSLIGEKVDFIVTDVSFISLKLIIPNAVNFCRKGTEFICLIKPQFEAEKNEVGSGGIVRNEEVRRRVCRDITGFGENFGFVQKGLAPSPITGAKGNVEYLARLIYNSERD